MAQFDNNLLLGPLAAKLKPSARHLSVIFDSDLKTDYKMDCFKSARCELICTNINTMRSDKCDNECFCKTKIVKCHKNNYLLITDQVRS